MKQSVIISGGTSGIGLAAAKLLSEEGWLPVLLGRDEEKGRRAAESILGSVFLPCDVTDSEACRKAAAQAEERAPLRGIVTCAGVYGEGLLENLTDEEIDTFFRINVYGTLYLVRAALPFMKRRGGSVVTIASDAALQGNVQCSLYGATKGAVAAFTRSFALEAAVYGIRANCICPGDIDTPLLEKQMSRYGVDEVAMAEQYPLGRIGRAEEAAQLISFLLSNKASFMTGVVIPIDGGLTDW